MSNALGYTPVSKEPQYIEVTYPETSKFKNLVADEDKCNLISEFGKDLTYIGGTKFREGNNTLIGSSVEKFEYDPKKESILIISSSSIDDKTSRKDNLKYANKRGRKFVESEILKNLPGKKPIVRICVGEDLNLPLSKNVLLETKSEMPGEPNKRIFAAAFIYPNVGPISDK